MTKLWQRFRLWVLRLFWDTPDYMGFEGPVREWQHLDGEEQKALYLSAQIRKERLRKRLREAVGEMIEEEPPESQFEASKRYFEHKEHFESLVAEISDCDVVVNVVEQGG